MLWARLSFLIPSISALVTKSTVIVIVFRLLLECNGSMFGYSLHRRLPVHLCACCVFGLISPTAETSRIPQVVAVNFLTEDIAWCTVSKWHYSDDAMSFMVSGIILGHCHRVRLTSDYCNVTVICLSQRIFEVLSFGYTFNGKFSNHMTHSWFHFLHTKCLFSLTIYFSNARISMAHLVSRARVSWNKSQY